MNRLLTVHLMIWMKQNLFRGFRDVDGDSYYIGIQIDEKNYEDKYTQMNGNTGDITDLKGEVKTRIQML